MVTIQKSHDDYRHYYCGNLDNGLRYVIVHDPKVNMDSMSLNLRCGSMQDPSRLEGIGEYVRLTVVNDCKSFPDEPLSTYSLFQAGCFDSAVYPEDTIFNMEVPDICGGIERLSTHLMKPNFRTEVNHKLLSQIDNAMREKRQSQCHRSERLFHFLAKDGSRLQKIYSANSRTLSLPNIQVLAQRFYTEYYRPELMTLCIVTSLDVKDIEKCVITHFDDFLPVCQLSSSRSGSPRSSAGSSSSPRLGEDLPYDEQNCGNLIKVVSVDSSRLVKLSWNLDISTRKYYKSNPLGYLACLIHQEIFNRLRIKKLATGVDIMETFPTATSTCFSVTAEITSRGFQNYKEVVKTILEVVTKAKRLADDFGSFVAVSGEARKEFDCRFSRINAVNAEDIASKLRTHHTNLS